MRYEKVLVTGADGFIGSHLTEHLIRRGYGVRAFVLYNSFNSRGWLDSLPKGECYAKNEKISSISPLTWQRAKSAIVRSTMRKDLDTTRDFLRNLANQCP